MAFGKKQNNLDRRASSARPVRLLARLLSSMRSDSVRLIAFAMSAIIVYK